MQMSKSIDTFSNTAKFVHSMKKVRKEVIEEEPCIIVDIDDSDDTDHAKDVSDASFLNPSQNDNPSSANNFKCEMCDLSSETKICIN